MSGIYGFISKRDNIVEEALLSAIRVWNLAYGKDAQNSINEKGFCLGCCKDVINSAADLTDPVIIHDKKYYVIDALIYNREELIRKVGLSVSVSDEELLVEIIEQLGVDELKYVNGDFAGALYDSEKKELSLFRDHMGVRPLFYYKCNDFVAFSTDIRGIAGPHVTDIKVDDAWLYRRISGKVKDGLTNTEYSNVFCALPGSFMKFGITDDGITTSIRRYWKLGLGKIKLSSDAEYKKQLRELITDAVERRLKVVEGEVGAELSGGLDSSVIDIIINRTGRKCTYVSWSVSPEKQPLVNGDERLIIKDICEQEGIECTYEKGNIDENSLLVSNVRETGLNVDECSVLSLCFPPYINTLGISYTSTLLQKKGIKAVFTGHGGDEGVSHRPNPYEMFYHHEYYRYFRYMWSTTHGQKRRISNTIKKIGKNVLESKKNIKKPLIEPINASELFNPSFKARFDHQKEDGYYFGYDPKKFIMDGGSRNRLDNLALQGAYCGVRYLIPYLDYRVIDFAVSIPRYLYLKGRYERYIFREAFKDIMPKSLYKVTTKSENSRTAQEPDPNWYEKFFPSKARLVEKFDRSIWEKYLDFDRLEKFARCRKETPEEQEQEVYTCLCLEECLTAQNMLEKTREVFRLHDLTHSRFDNQSQK